MSLVRFSQYFACWTQSSKYCLYFVSGVSRSLHTEITQQYQNCLAKPNYFFPDEPVNYILSYLTHGKVPNSNKEIVHPLIVHGSRGWGKTRLTAILAQSAMTWDGGSPVVIYRSAGVTSGSLSLEQILTSVAEQICVVSGIHPMFAYKVSYVLLLFNNMENLKKNFLI